MKAVDVAQRAGRNKGRRIDAATDDGCVDGTMARRRKGADGAGPVEDRDQEQEDIYLPAGTWPGGVT